MIDSRMEIIRILGYAKENKTKQNNIKKNNKTAEYFLSPQGETMPL